MASIINAMATVHLASSLWIYVQVDVDIMVKERPMKSADIEAEWQIAPGPSGRAAVASIVPGGTLTFEHRNIARKGRQVAPCHALTLSAASTAGLAMLRGSECNLRDPEILAPPAAVRLNIRLAWH